MSASDRAPPIRSARHLAALLQVDTGRLVGTSNRAGKMYRLRQQPKEAGHGFRPISVPAPLLMTLQRRLLQQWLAFVPLDEGLHGATRGTSFITNATEHVSSEGSVRVDITNFFGNVSHRDVFAFFRRQGCSDRVASVLTKLTTHRRALPQGAPTSPLLAAHVLAPTFRSLRRAADRRGLTVTAYIDDITFSGHRAWLIVPEATRILRQSGFRVSPGKTKVSLPGDPYIVTGVECRGGDFFAPEAYCRQLELDLKASASGESVLSDELLRGRLAYVSSVNPAQAAALAERCSTVVEALR